MNVKKYTNNTWREIAPYKYSTSVETYTDLPQIIYASGNSASIGLKGALSQSGVPSPTNPIQPQWCGDLETTGEHAGQYKIPISSASTTTPVYLGEVHSTRQIKKLVLTGEENDWIKASQYNVFANTNITSDCYNPSGIITCICSHYAAQGNVSGVRLVNDLSCCFRTTSKTFYIGDNTHTDLESFLTYLQQQYANGTPVTIWYVLAEPTTGIVNEPIRKIGDYADSVSGITIPTITGKDTFDVLTTLKPSEVSLAYTGWHDATVEEWDGSQWQ